MAECEAVKVNGRMCGAHALKGSQYCFMHDPSRAAERQDARKRGGYRRGAHSGDVSSLPLHIRAVSDVLTLLDYIAREVLALDNGVPRARVLIALASEYIHAIEVGDIEQRLQNLEAVINVKR